MVNGRPYGYGVCEFEFSQLSIGPEVSVVITGRNSLSLVIENNVTISTHLSLNGESGKSGIFSGLPGPGGWPSGRSSSNADLPSFAHNALSGSWPGGGSAYETAHPQVPVVATEGTAHPGKATIHLVPYTVMITSPI